MPPAGLQNQMIDVGCAGDLHVDMILVRKDDDLQAKNLGYLYLQNKLFKISFGKQCINQHS